MSGYRGGRQREGGSDAKSDAPVLTDHLRGKPSSAVRRRSLYHFYNLHCEDHHFHSLQTLSHMIDDLSNRNYL